MSDEMNLKERLKGPTPAFFKRIVKIAISLAAAGTALLTTESMIDNFTLPAMIHKIAQWLIVAGIVAAAVSKTTVDNKPADQQ